MNKSSKIYIAGHRGMVGSSIWRTLESKGYNNLIGRTSKELNLKSQERVGKFFRNESPEVVIDAAARVGGILANRDYPYNFLMENLQIQNNLIDAAHKHNVSKFIFLGSSCIYPKNAPQPLKEDYLLTDSLEPTNEWYAVAKIAGVKACEAIRNQHGKDFVSLMPTNLYGPNDNFDLKTSHVLPAMIRKFHEAKHATFDSKRDNNKFPHGESEGHSTVTLWGSGSPMREFLYVDDLAEAVAFALENQLSENLYNLGTGKDITIRELAETIQNIIGHKGSIDWDTSKPDGTPRKLLDVSKLKKEGWESNIELKKGILETYEWFLENENKFKEVKI